MRAGLLTFHEADNYGAVLQAYALQHTLEKMGVDNEFVSIDMGKKVKAEETSDRRLMAFAKKIQMESEKRSALFKQFRENYFKCSPYYGMNEMQKLDEDYDLFFAGSDQIWNFQIPDTDGRYFLPFAVKAKRYSYAASFGGNELPAKMEKWCTEELKKFEKISVREESGKELVERLTGKEAVVSLDPTLLLSSDEWKELTHEVNEEPYLLLFLLKYDEAAVKRAKEEAEKRGLKLRVVTAAFIPQLGFDPWSKVGVNDWLSLFRHAECVITNSFHGVVFSIMFGRLFTVARLQGELSSRNGRIEELLTKAGLSECMEDIPEAIDYQAVENRLADMRVASLEYLKGAIS